MSSPELALEAAADLLTEDQKAVGLELMDALDRIDEHCPSIFSIIAAMSEGESSGKVTFSPREVGINVGLTGGKVENLINAMGQASFFVRRGPVSVQKACLHLDEVVMLESGESLLTVLDPRVHLNDIFGTNE